MGYLLKSMVLKALEEDMITTQMCCNDDTVKEIVEISYHFAKLAVDKLPSYYPNNMVEKE